MTERLREMASNVVDEVEERAREGVEQALENRADDLDETIKGRLEEMVGVVSSSAEETGMDKFTGVDEEDILTFVPDRRRLSGIGTLLLGLLFLALLPGVLKVVSLLFFATGLATFGWRYVSKAKVDVPDGYRGVICRKGKPMPGETAKVGRNWLFRYLDHIPYLVSGRDQVVDMVVANFTSDFATISLKTQLVFRVVEPARFIAGATPASLMKILDLYASYIGLRMITSIEDARVKFVGRDHLGNVIDSLNRYLSDSFGIEVVRVTMPEARNEILGDLEEIRTQLKQVASMKETFQVRLESEVKAVESQVRKQRKGARGEALELQQSSVRLDTNVSERLHTEREKLKIGARRRLEQVLSELRREIANLRARIEKAKVIALSIGGLQEEFGLRLAALKRRAFRRLVPRRIDVFSVPGIGPGLGMSAGNSLFRRMLDASSEGASGGEAEGGGRPAEAGTGAVAEPEGDSSE